LEGTANNINNNFIEGRETRLNGSLTSYPEIWLHNMTYTNLTANIIKNVTFSCIDLVYANNHLAFFNNRLSICQYGMRPLDSPNTIINNNSFDSMSTAGIYASTFVAGGNSDNYTITNNLINNSEDTAIVINGFNNSLIVGNILFNTSQLYGGIELQEGSHNSTIAFNNLTDAYILVAGKNSLIRNNKIQMIGRDDGHSTCFSISSASENNWLINNSMNNCYRGFDIFGGKNNRFLENSISCRNLGHGFELGGFANNLTLIQNNNISNCRRGISIGVSSASLSIKRNSIQNSSLSAIEATITDGILIESNNISNSALALDLYTDNNYIISNILLQNVKGLNIPASTGNFFYNNLFNNTNNFDSVASSNYFNISINCSQGNIIGGNCIGGNYYSDYSGVDANRDGFGDTPYTVSAGYGVYDYLPLVESVPCTILLANTSWSGWIDFGSCDIHDNQTQIKNLTQYDSNNCGSYENRTFFQYQNVSCNYCSYNLINTSWGWLE
jgi:nitrous oxidase accessory protein NosD